MGFEQFWTHVGTHISNMDNNCRLELALEASEIAVLTIYGGCNNGNLLIRGK